MADQPSLGADFARALARKDAPGLQALLAPEVDFRALTPRRNWEAQDPDGVLAIVFDNWFEDSDEIDSLEQIESDSFADRQRVGYRLVVSNPEGRFLIEQQAYLSAGDGQDGRDDSGKIAWMRVVCSGYRPLADGQS
ncbi:MAG TPA: hypothetical protein VHT25_10160 [Solirubrobacteraceae bacterium]|jgi:hypothetical protein|nr:hypothetical protein [Solirubrobacteraceae bacterium]